MRVEGSQGGNEINLVYVGRNSGLDTGKGGEGAVKGKTQEGRTYYTWEVVQKRGSRCMDTLMCVMVVGINLLVNICHCRVASTPKGTTTLSLGRPAWLLMNNSCCATWVQLTLGCCCLVCAWRVETCQTSQHNFLSTIFHGKYINDEEQIDKPTQSLTVTLIKEQRVLNLLCQVLSVQLLSLPLPLS